jgi:hypothetical protein
MSYVKHVTEKLKKVEEGSNNLWKIGQKFSFEPIKSNEEWTKEKANENQKDKVNKLHNQILDLDYKLEDILDKLKKFMSMNGINKMNNLKRELFDFIYAESAEWVGEDVGFCLAAKKAGYKIYLDMDTRVKHLCWEDGSLGNQEVSIEEAYDETMRSLLVIKKYTEALCRGLQNNNNNNNG